MTNLVDLAHGWYTAGAMTKRSASPPETGIELTDAEVNAITAEVERRAESEMFEGTPEFLDWLHSNKRILLDWQEYRVAMLSEHEQAEIIRDL